MTREENLHWIDQEIQTWENECQSKHPIKEALYAARKVLEQEPRKGHWIVDKWGNISCSECGCNALYDKVYTDNSPSGKAIRIKSTFCPTCGADMREVEDGKGLLPSVTPQKPKTGYLSIDDVMSVFDDFMCGDVDEESTETFWEMLKDKAESEVEE